MANPNITAERIREIVSYDPDTGVFVWRVKRNKCPVGKRVGFPRNKGDYWKARIDYQVVYLHRVAWLYMTGTWPTLMIDHVDGDKGNNSWSNLREVTQKQNQENRTKQTKSKSGIRGVDWSAREKKFRARITHNRMAIHLGWFHTLNEAINARDQAEIGIYTHTKLAFGPQPENPDVPVQSRETS